MQTVTIIGIYPASNRIAVHWESNHFTPYVVASYPQVLTENGNYEPLRAIVGDTVTICWSWGHYFTNKEDAVRFAAQEEITYLS